MDKRLKSYQFKCPCCNVKHERLFEYFTKFQGPIKEYESLEDYPDAYMMERVVVSDGIFEERTLRAGEKTYRCSACYEYFRFNGFEGEPKKLNDFEKIEAGLSFKPIRINYDRAVMNSVASLVEMLNKYGCEFDYKTGNIVIQNTNGKKYVFDISDALVSTLYKDNPMFEIADENDYIIQKS